MKTTVKVSFLTATLLALSAHTVAAETTQPQTTTNATTVEVTTVQPTTETTTTSKASLPKDSKNDVYKYKADEAPKYTGIYKADGETYYQVDSKPITNTWKWHSGRWYYFGEDGKMLKSTVTPDGYLVDSEGLLVSPGWNYQGGKWYYAESVGKVFRGDWKKIGGVWYAFHQNGVMYSHEWKESYFLKDSGAMADDEWVFDRNYNSWFYIKPGGIYASREWKGNYYLKAGGYMAKSEFIYDPNYRATYYLQADGIYVRNQWLQIQGKWYHFRKYGELDANKWVGSYYVKSDGKMAENEWIYDHNYGGYFYLKADGIYVNNIYTIDGKKHAFQENGLWIGEVPESVKYGQYNNVIFLDPGHGGYDSGAVANGLQEKNLTLQVYKKLRSQLEKNGYTVLTSRDRDVYVDFKTDRSAMANESNADIFISIHFNASGSGNSPSGIETYHYEEEAGYPSQINQLFHNNPVRLSESQRLAQDIHESVVAQSGANDRGVHGASYAVLRETTKPAVLLELGYIDNYEESKKISDSSYQDKLVSGIVSGIQHFYKTTK